MSRHKFKEQHDPLNQAISREKQLTADFYLKMSGQVPWKDAGEKQRYAAAFKALSEEIKRLQGETTAEWFAKLP